jgi:hypothetical protein
MPAQRELTDWEIAGLLLRHPLEADYVAKTKLALASGTYDWARTLPQSFIGLIPPWGETLEDSTYGHTVIFFDANGVLHVSGYVDANLDTTAAMSTTDYVPPPFKCKNGGDPLPILGTCPEDFNILFWILGAGVLALLVFLAIEYGWFAKAKPRRAS